MVYQATADICMSKDKLKEIYDRIQTFEVESAPDKCGNDIQGVLDIMADLVTELRRLEGALNRTANVASCLANGIQPD